jgi:trans-aconitate 2-methyltransferase
MDPWKPDQYLRFRGERRQPFFDLMGLVQPRPGMKVVDLGCGTGELTRKLHQHLNARETLGIDNSDSMLAKSSAFEGEGVRFEKGDIADRSETKCWDLVFSNAALHWIPDHRHLLKRLTSLLSDEGQIAVQVPANHNHPASALAAELGSESPFREAMGGYVRKVPVLEAEQYAKLLNELGFTKQHVRIQVYGHPMSSWEEVVQWQKGTLLTTYERRMTAELYNDFVARYRERLGDRLEHARPYLFLFKRVLFWGQL